MKSYFYTLVFLFGILQTSAQVAGVESIKISGDNDKRINLVIMGDGYTVSEQEKFITDATNFSNEFFSKSPFKEYENFFNIHAIKVISIESGADIPRNNIFVDTFFNATFDAFGNQYLLFYEIDKNNANNTEAKIVDVLANNFPNYDVALILVNTPDYGGSGGKFPMCSTNAEWGNKVAIHELAHTLFKLKDEYYPGDVLAAEAVNMTKESDPLKVKWKNWIGINNIGVYPYTGSGNASSWYKPAKATCIMESVDQNFCSVCTEGVIEKIHELISPIESFTPISTNLNLSELPLDFELNLITPAPNTLQSEWHINNIPFASNVNKISLTDTDLIEKLNTVTAVITDNSDLLKIDNHETVHFYTVTWTIEGPSTNNFTISMYPNPTNDIINFKFQNSKNLNLSIDIIGVEGKKIKSLNISNHKIEKLDVSDLSAGVYMVNFYVNDVRVTTKKIVKN